MAFLSGQIAYSLSGLYAVHTLYHGGITMEKNEIAFAKQSLLTIKDWDAFQALMRKYMRLNDAVRNVIRLK
jgi:predicted Mrr-cat superfamily restriction endonuclease